MKINRSYARKFIREINRQINLNVQRYNKYVYDKLWVYIFINH